MTVQISTAEQREVYFMSPYMKAFPGAAYYVSRIEGSLEEQVEHRHNAYFVIRV